MTGLFLGVDAGNSKTDALLCDAEGHVLGHGRDGNGDIYGAHSPSAAVEAVFAAIRHALAGRSYADVAGAAFRLAGIDWPEDEKFWSDQLADVFPRYSIANDGFAPLRFGSASGVGIAVVAGTGPAVAGRGPDGTEWSASFWVQDGLGAGGLGDEGLKAVFRAELGLGPVTLMTTALLELLGQDDIEGALHTLTSRERPAMSRAAFAPLVTRAAADGDSAALGIVQGQAERFAGYARIVALRVGFDPMVARDAIPVVLAGSVLTSEPPVMADALAAALAEQLPGAEVQVAPLPPVVGAALDALAEAGLDITDQVRTHIATSGGTEPA